MGSIIERDTNPDKILPPEINDIINQDEKYTGNFQWYGNPWMVHCKTHFRTDGFAGELRLGLKVRRGLQFFCNTIR